MGGGKALRELMQRPGVVVAPGAYDVASARLVEQLGFSSVYLGGLAGSASMLGVPDHSLITMPELLDHTRRVAAVVDIPIIADIDDGGGTPLNVYRTVRQFESAGAAAIHVEDHIQGKHFGPGGTLISKGSMVQKVKAAVDARRDDAFVLVARCDALFVGESLDAALDRGVAYAGAGADMLFFAGLRLPDMKRVADTVGVPVLNVVQNTPVPELERNGLKVAIYPTQALMVALKAVRDLLQDLKAHGSFTNLEQVTLPRQDFGAVVGNEASVARAKQYGLI